MMTPMMLCFLERSGRKGGRQQGRRNVEKDRRTCLALKKAVRLVTGAASNPKPNLRGPRKLRVLSDIDSNDGALSQGCAVESVDDQVLQLLAQKQGMVHYTVPCIH